MAGVDEAGRGAWAGPLVAAAVVLPPATPTLRKRLSGLRDSKQLGATQRERLYGRIGTVAVAIGVGLVTAARVDLLGLTRAGRLAMQRAVEALTVAPDYLLIDAFALPGTPCPQEAIIFGDALCLSIAAASIVAKVQRDRLLVELAGHHPGFGFDQNKGYGTAAHRRALAAFGPTPEHRFSYAPVRANLVALGIC